MEQVTYYTVMVVYAEWPWDDDASDFEVHQVREEWWYVDHDQAHRAFADACEMYKADEVLALEEGTASLRSAEDRNSINDKHHIVTLDGPAVEVEMLERLMDRKLEDPGQWLRDLLQEK